MGSYNLSLLSDVERRDLELKRQASLLIYLMKKGKINRGNVNIEINKLTGHEQERFKKHLNFYKAKK